MRTLLDMESEVLKQLGARRYGEALAYTSQLTNHCSDSMKCIGYRLEALVGQGKLGEAIELTTRLQSLFRQNAEFIYWCGRLMTYNSNTEKGKSCLREALNMDPDNVLF